MKKIYLALLLVLTLTLSACTQSTTFKVGVDFFPMPQILELIESDLKKDNLNVEAVRINYENLNRPLLNDEINGNMIQHQYYMEFFNKANEADLVIAQQIYHSKFAIFSNVYENVEEINNGETVYMPSDVVNLSRALILLESNGLITLKEGVVKTASKIEDIASNPKQLKFELSTINLTPNMYQTNGKRLAIMYPSYVLQTFGSINEAEFLANEVLNDLTKTYAISFVVRKGNLNNTDVQTFIKHLTSDKVRTWIIENYGFAAVPAF